MWCDRCDWNAKFDLWLKCTLVFIPHQGFHNYLHFCQNLIHTKKKKAKHDTSSLCTKRLKRLYVSTDCCTFCCDRSEWGKMFNTAPIVYNDYFLLFWPFKLNFPGESQSHCAELWRTAPLHIYSKQRGITEVSKVETSLSFITLTYCLYKSTQTARLKIHECL